jgi:crotonobetainyl-CoA:carnitine CoA-transferase CaiB-like acyl-CoA transferase
MAGEGTTRRQPLAGLRVVEFADTPAGEATGKLLGDMGAEVIKVEGPEGAASRRIGPFLGDVEDGERSLRFWFYNTSKLGVMLDLATLEGRARFQALLRGADILVHDVHPQGPRLQQPGAEVARGVNPRLIVCAISPFGQDGPWASYRDSDLVALAAGGPLWTCGYDDLTIPPILPGGGQSYHVAASFAFNAILLALLERQRTGQGQTIDAAVHDALAVTVEMSNPYWFYNKTLVRRQTCRHAAPVLTQPAIFRCADGRWVYFVLVIAEAKAWGALTGWMDRYGLALDLTEPKFEDASYRRANFSYIQGIVESFAAILDAQTFFQEAQEAGLPVGAIYAPEDVLKDPHLLAREFFVTVEHETGPVTYPGAPYRFSEMEWRIQRRAPHLGEHNNRLAEWAKA